MHRVIIESPYAGDLDRNLEYLRLTIRDSVRRGEAPFASHRMYPGALDDNLPVEHRAGILCGFVWWEVADFIAFYIDYGFSPGMEEARRQAVLREKPYVVRRILDEDS